MQTQNNATGVRWATRNSVYSQRDTYYLPSAVCMAGKGMVLVRAPLAVNLAGWSPDQTQVAGLFKMEYWRLPRP